MQNEFLDNKETRAPKKQRSYSSKPRRPISEQNCLRPCCRKSCLLSICKYYEIKIILKYTENINIISASIYFNQYILKFYNEYYKYRELFMMAIFSTSS